MSTLSKITDGDVNRTGMKTSDLADAMRQVPEMTRPATPEGGLEKIRTAYLKETSGLGTVPHPASAKGTLKTAMEAIKGNKALILIDKTAERLAFERTGVRLYEALLGKLDALGGFDGGPSREEMQTIRDEELSHARMLATTLEELGGDPTALTPSADLVAVEGEGLGKAVSDPRTTLGQGLHALLIAELADGAGWTELRGLAQGMGHSELAERFAGAEKEEERHLEWVHGWVEAYTKGQAELF